MSPISLLAKSIDGVAVWGGSRRNDHWGMGGRLLGYIISGCFLSHAQFLSEGFPSTTCSSRHSVLSKCIGPSDYGLNPVKLFDKITLMPLS